MFVIGNETYSDTHFMGARVKRSVVRPDDSGNKPDLSFEAPTCLHRGLGLFLHGKVGYFISQTRDLCEESFDSQFIWGMDNYKNRDQIQPLQDNNPHFVISRKTYSFKGSYRENRFIDRTAPGMNSIRPLL